MESELFLQPLGGLELDFVIFTTLSGTLKIQKRHPLRAAHTRTLRLPKYSPRAIVLFIIKIPRSTLKAN